MEVDNEAEEDRDDDWKPNDTDDDGEDDEDSICKRHDEIVHREEYFACSWNKAHAS